MRGLLVVGGIALGILLVAASHQDQSETGIEAKDETVQEDFVKERQIRLIRGRRNRTKTFRPGEFSSVSILTKPSIYQNKEDLVKQREIRSIWGRRNRTKTYRPGEFSTSSILTAPSIYLNKEDLVKERKTRSPGENRKKVRPTRKPGMFSALDGVITRVEKRDIKKDREIRSTGGSKKKSRTLRRTPGVYSPLSRPSKTKRSVKQSSPQEKPKKCIGCYTSLIVKSKEDPLLKRRLQRETEEHEKIKKRRKHRKDKKKSKKRRKHHKHRDPDFETEDPMIGGGSTEPEKKKKAKHNPGYFSSISSVLPTGETDIDTDNMKRKDPGLDDNNNKRHKHRERKNKWQHRSRDHSAISSVLPTERTHMDNDNIKDVTN